VNQKCSTSYTHRRPDLTDLHQVVRENFHQVFFEKETQGACFPFHLKREFEKYLACGILSFGFARFSCGHCRKDKLVAYSCKGRAFCPSCTGRRMADTARHLVDNVIPEVPVRQWVLSMPYTHRFLLSSNPKLLSTALGIYHRLIGSFYKKRAKKSHLKDPKVGAISVIQRFGGALNLNVHFHTLFMDGVYYQNDQGEQVFREIVPSDQDVADLVKKAQKRINRAFYNRGFLDSLLIEERSLESSIDEDPQLSLIKSESVQNRVDGYQRPKNIGKWGESLFEEFSGGKFAY
jgi:hypothetical protein